MEDASEYTLTLAEVRRMIGGEIKTAKAYADSSPDHPDHIPCYRKRGPTGKRVYRYFRPADVQAWMQARTK